MILMTICCTYFNATNLQCPVQIICCKSSSLGMFHVLCSSLITNKPVTNTNSMGVGGGGYSCRGHNRMNIIEEYSGAVSARIESVL